MATELNLEIDQGSTFTKNISWRDADNVAYNLSTWAARMMIRKHYADKDKSAPVVSLTSVDGITLGSSGDNIIITITDDLTEDIPGGIYYYDLELISPSQEVTKLLRGKVTVVPEVTR